MNELDLFIAAQAITDPAERAAYLNSACEGNGALRERLGALLAGSAQSQSPLDQLSLGPTSEYSSPTVEQAHQPAVSIDLSMRTRDSVPDTADTVIAEKYTLIELIGQGGMGSVWRAKQTEPVKRQVAIKLIKAGMDSRQVLARFEAERQALALMDHPNIAKVFDGGLHHYRPYFVMELVKGIPITDYCDQHRLNPQQRLELFVNVCQAIQHAHQKGIIHRDIKPSNVMVAMYDDKPVVKVIDFGVAKATGGALTEQTIDTGIGNLVGTPQYMSPEQATFNNLDIDTRSDVYALGILLYELLTGSPPFSKKELERKGLLEMLRVVREEEPPRPSTKLSTADALPTLSANRSTEPKKLTGLLRDELDWVVMKALEKDRSRRYETANGFAADILRYLSGEPVLAHPPSTAYRVSKFIRRHRVQVIATSLVAFTLLAGIAGTTWGMLRAQHFANAEGAARSKAEAAYQKTADVLDAMVSEVTGDSLATQKVISEEQKKFLESVLGYYREFAFAAGDDQTTRARTALAAFRVGLIESRLGRSKEGAAAFTEASHGFESLAADYPAVREYGSNLAASQSSLGNLLAGIGDLAAAKEHYRKGLAIRDKLAAAFPMVPEYRKDLARSHISMGNLHAIVRENAMAEEQLRRALEIQEKLSLDFSAVPEYRRELAASHNNLGLLLFELGKRAESESAYRKALAIWEKLAADFPLAPEYRHNLAQSNNNLGILLNSLGKNMEAEAQFRNALAIWEKLVADFPGVPEHRHELGRSHNDIGNLLTGLGQLAEAERQYRKGLAILEKLATDYPNVPRHREVLSASHHNLGNLLAGLRQFAEAEAQYRKGLAILEKLVADYPDVPGHRNRLSGIHISLGNQLILVGQIAAAEEQYRKGLAIQNKLAADFPTVPNFRSELARSCNNLGLLLVNLGRRLEAEAQYRRGMAHQENLAAEYPAVLEYQIDLGGGYCNFGNLVRDGGDPAGSMKWYTLAIDRLKSAQEKEPRAVTARRFLRNSHHNRALAYDRLMKFPEALKDWDRAIELSPPEEQATRRASRATSRLQAGMVAEAVVEVAELTKPPVTDAPGSVAPKWNANQWYDFACVYSIASGKLADKKTENADRAMEMLRTAVKSGFNNAAHIKQDKDLDPLRARDDFKKLVAELEAKSAKPAR